MQASGWLVHLSGQVLFLITTVCPISNSSPNFHVSMLSSLCVYVHDLLENTKLNWNLCWMRCFSVTHSRGTAGLGGP